MKENFQPPTGLAKELNKSAELWPTLDVKNEVVWVNDQIDFPFNIKLGESTNLASVLALDRIDTRKVELEKRHSRSAILGRVIFKDKQGNLYRDVDLKGVGYSMSNEDGFLEVRTSDDIDAIRLRKGEVAGFQRLQAANHETEFSEKLFQIGVRTSRVIAVVRLDEIMAAEGKMSLDEATEKKIIPVGFTPAVLIRAFGTRARFGESAPIEKEKLFYEDARKLVSEELGISPENFNWDDYVRWFAKNLAKNMGLLHKNGMYYKYSLNTVGHPSNVSLDCRFVDHESVGYLNHFQSQEIKEKLIRTDVLHLGAMVISMSREICDLFNVEIDEDPLRQIIESAYEETGNLFPDEGEVFEQ